MTTRPVHRRPLAIELTSWRDGAHLERPRVVRPRPARPRARLTVERRVILLAVTPPVLHQHLALGLRALRIESLTVYDRSDLFELLADRRAPLVLADGFDGLAAAPLVAMIRATGCTTPVIVVGAGPASPGWMAGQPAVAVVGDPVVGATPATNPWLRRCVEAFGPRAR